MLKLHQLCLYLHNKVNGAILEAKEAQILLHISLAVSIGARLTLNIPFLDMVAEFILHKKLSPSVLNILTIPLVVLLIH